MLLYTQPYSTFLTSRETRWSNTLRSMNGESFGVRVRLGDEKSTAVRPKRGIWPVVHSMLLQR